MSYEQTRDVIEKARQFHHELQAFYRRSEEGIAKERMRLLLDYLSRHEAWMEAQLDQFEHTAASQAALETWLKFVPPPHITETLAKLRITPEMTSAEVIKLALDLDDHLLNLYRQAAEASPTEDVREVFEKLVAECRRERKRVVRDVYEPE